MQSKLEPIDSGQTNDIEISPGTSNNFTNHMDCKLKDDNLLILKSADDEDVVSHNSIESVMCRICQNSENSEKYNNYFINFVFILLNIWLRRYKYFFTT